MLMKMLKTGKVEFDAADNLCTGINQPSRSTYARCEIFWAGSAGSYGTYLGHSKNKLFAKSL